jgi:hypothetical protein
MSLILLWTAAYTKYSLTLLSHINRFTATPNTLHPLPQGPEDDFLHLLSNNFGNFLRLIATNLPYLATHLPT